MTIETADGQQIETGFGDDDMATVQLGELGPINTQQFLDYAVAALVEVIPRTRRRIQKNWAQDIKYVHENLVTLPMLTKNKRSKHKVVDLLQHSPFRMRPDAQQIDILQSQEVQHTISAEKFYHLVSYVIDGSFWGWGLRGVFPEAKEAAARLDKELQKHTRRLGRLRRRPQRFPQE